MGKHKVKFRPHPSTKKGFNSMDGDDPEVTHSARYRDSKGNMYYALTTHKATLESLTDKLTPPNDSLDKTEDMCRDEESPFYDEACHVESRHGKEAKPHRLIVGACRPQNSYGKDNTQPKVKTAAQNSCNPGPTQEIKLSTLLLALAGGVLVLFICYKFARNVCLPHDDHEDIPLQKRNANSKSANNSAKNKEHVVAIPPPQRIEIKIDSPQPVTSQSSSTVTKPLVVQTPSVNTLTINADVSAVKSGWSIWDCCRNRPQKGLSTTIPKKTYGTFSP